MTTRRSGRALPGAVAEIARIEVELAGVQRDMDRPGSNGEPLPGSPRPGRRGRPLLGCAAWTVSYWY